MLLESTEIIVTPPSRTRYCWFNRSLMKNKPHLASKRRIYCLKQARLAKERELSEMLMFSSIRFETCKKRRILSCSETRGKERAYCALVSRSARIFSLACCSVRNMEQIYHEGNDAVLSGTVKKGCEWEQKAYRDTKKWHVDRRAL